MLARDVVAVELSSRRYEIRIGPGQLSDLGSSLAELVPARRATVISDRNVAPLYADRLGRSLLDADIEYTLLAVPPGDASKSLEMAGELFDELAIGRHGRDVPIIALGGGMVGDLAGFVAATWHRGVPFVQCPTTLEAMIDASIGGKTAVNLPAGKNLIGVFYQPVFVCIDTNCLASLGDRDFRSGLAESVKHAVIAGGDFLDWHQTNCDAIRNREPGILQELIRRNCGIKAAIVMADERETATNGVGRAALNFGHTIGHALESQSRYQLRHGEAVALGMVAAMELAVRIADFPVDSRARVESLLVKLGLPIRAANPIDTVELAFRIGGDKKAMHEGVRFVLPGRGGEMKWFGPIPGSDIDSAMRRLNAP